MSDKLRNEQNAGRRAVEEAARRPAPTCLLRYTETILGKPNMVLDDYEGAYVGPAPAGGKSPMVIMGVNNDEPENVVCLLASRYGAAATSRRGRPCDPTLDVEIAAARERIGGAISKRPLLVAEVVAAFRDKGYRNDPIDADRDTELVEKRIQRFQKLMAALKQSFK